MDWTLALGALVVGIVVGLTGMGGGALMTPMLVLFFGVSPLAAVSSDLVASAVMKPVGSVVHLRHGTVRLDLVRWLCLGSVPAAFAGVLVSKALGHGSGVEHLNSDGLNSAKSSTPPHRPAEPAPASAPNLRRARAAAR